MSKGIIVSKKRVGTIQNKRSKWAWFPLVVTAALAVGSIAKWSQADRREFVQHYSADGDQAQPNLPGIDLSSTSQPGRGLATPEMLLGDQAFASVPMIQQGTWSVDDSIWCFENREVTDDELASEMRSITDAANRVESSAAEHLSLLDLLPIQRADVRRESEVTIRSASFPTVQIAMFYRESDKQTFIQAAKVANQMDRDRWQVITLTPRVDRRAANEHLLPMAGIASSVCRRVSRTGQVQCEILETTQSMENLVRGWQADRWLVKPFDADNAQATVWSCVKGGLSVQVRVTPDALNSKLTLVVTALNSL